MKLLFGFFTIYLLASCGTSRHFIANDVELNTLSSLLRKLDRKKYDSPELRNQIYQLYSSATQRLQNDIETYKSLSGTDKWDKAIGAYNTLNKLADVILRSRARNFISPVYYHGALQQVTQDAANDYYNAGIEIMKVGNKTSYRKAYDLFSKANKYLPGFRDVKRKMHYTWERSVLNVVINPVTDHSAYYAQMIPNRFGNSFNSDMLQRNLVRDLGGDFRKNAPAKFFTDYEAKMARIDVDWLIDITWTRLDVPFPFTQTSTVKRKKEIEIGKDTLNKPVYQTVEATLRVTRKYFTAYGEIECRITEANTRQNITLNRYPSQIDWSQNYATYTGDRRALTNTDWAMVNNVVRIPTRDAILGELYKQIYPIIKNGIYNQIY